MKDFINAIINNHFRLTALASIVTIIIFTWFSQEIDFEKVSSKIVSMSLLLLGSVVFSKFYNRYDNNTDEKIWQNPIAVAIYLGSITIGFALAVTL